eukprot:850627-Prymnesium_polylepis.1
MGSCARQKKDVKIYSQELPVAPRRRPVTSWRAGRWPETPIALPAMPQRRCLPTPKPHAHPRTARNGKRPTERPADRGGHGPVK